MILVAFKENDPYLITEYPFDDMYVYDRKFIKLGVNQDVWCGILIGNNEDILQNSIPVTVLSEFINTQTNTPLSKNDVIRKIYTLDMECKILRDAAAGRNLDRFSEYDQFVESIPSM